MAIVVSYRSEDAQGLATRILDQLSGKLDDHALTIGTVKLIKPGDDYVEAIEEGIQKADALLVLIGGNWQGAWLQDKDDYDYIAIESAIRQKRRVIPVLLDGAKMPTQSDLPEALAGLARRAGLTVAEGTLRDDMAKLYEVLGTVSSAPPASSAPSPQAQAQSQPPAQVQPPQTYPQPQQPYGQPNFGQQPRPQQPSMTGQAGHLLNIDLDNYNPQFHRIWQIVDLNRIGNQALYTGIAAIGWGLGMVVFGAEPYLGFITGPVLILSLFFALKSLIPIYSSSKIFGLGIMWALGFGIMGIALGAALDQDIVRNSFGGYSRSPEDIVQSARGWLIGTYIFSSMFFFVWSGFSFMDPVKEDKQIVKQNLRMGGTRTSTALIMGGGVCLALAIAIALGAALVDPDSDSSLAIGFMIGGAAGGAAASQVILWQLKDYWRKIRQTEQRLNSQPMQTPH